MVSEILIRIKAFRWMMLMAINILSVTHVLIWNRDFQINHYQYKWEQMIPSNKV